MGLNVGHVNTIYFVLPETIKVAGYPNIVL